MLGVSMRLPEPVDLAAPLRLYIASNYSEAELQSVLPALSNTASLRQRVHQSIVKNDADSDATVQLFLSYYSNLLSLQQHFPFGNTPPPSSMLGLRAVKAPTVRVCYTWYDSFRHTSKVSDYDVAFELNSVLFDTAALYSRRATSIKGQATAADDSPIKEACRLFQLSAGLFDHLQHSATTTSSSGLSVDLSSEGLSMLTKLMLAQAQACFFEKSTYTTSPKLVAKLAMGVSELFKESTRLCAVGRMKSLQGQADVYNWETHCYYQMLCYNAAAHYWYSKGLLADDLYGEEIAHLDRARALLDAASKVEGSLLRNLADNRGKLLQAIQQRLTAALKDNDTIYMSTVPRPDTVKDPEAVVTVKLTPFTAPDAVDPYAGLLSPLVRQQSDEFRTKLKEAMAKMEREAQESGDYSKATLSSLGLPAALEAEEGEQGLSDDLWGQVSAVQYKGGRDSLEAQIERIDISVREAKSAVQSIVEELSKEKAEDDSMRQQFGSRWNRRPSEQLTAQFSRDVDIVRKYLQEADKSNAKVKAELERNAAALDALMQPRQQIDARLPHNTQVAAQSSQVKREAGDRLHTLLDALSALIDERAQVLVEAQAAAAKHDIVPVINAQAGRGKSIEAIWGEELAQYDVYRQRMTELHGRQEGLLHDLKSTMDVYESSSRQKTTTTVTQRQSVLQELNDGIRTFDRLLANLNEGAKFYSDLQAQRIQPLRQRVEDFAMARRMESQMVLSQLTQDIASYRDEPSGQRSSFGSPKGGAGGASAGPHPINPNLAYEHPDQPMYDFAPPPPQPVSRQATPPSNPFAEYTANPAAGGYHQQQQQPPQSQYGGYQAQQGGAAAAATRYTPSQPAAGGYQQQQAGYHQRQPSQPDPYAGAPTNAYQPASSYPGQYQPAPYAPAPRAAAARAPDPPGIACPSCTYINPLGSVKCEICGNSVSSGAAGGTGAVPMPQPSGFLRQFNPR